MGAVGQGPQAGLDPHGLAGARSSLPGLTGLSAWPHHSFPFEACLARYSGPQGGSGLLTPPPGGRQWGSHRPGRHAV